MNKQEDFLQSVGESFEYANQYVQKEIDLVKLNFAEKVAKSSTSIITIFVFGFFATIVVIMLSIAAAFALELVLGSFSLAFLLVALFHLVLTLLIYLLREKLVTNPILSSLLKDFFD